MHSPKRNLAGALALGAALVASLPAAAGTLENLERERAILIENALDPEVSADARQSRIDNAVPRLGDLERMVLRDEDLTGRNTPAVRRAFQNYDLTFLVHAATEGNRSVIDHWLEQIGISTQTLMATQVRRR